MWLCPGSVILCECDGISAVVSVCVSVPTVAPNDQSTDNAFGTESAADNADLSAATATSTTGISVNSTGGGGAHNNMQPTIFISNVFIFSP